MDKIPLSPDHLRSLVGKHAVYRGEHCEIVEFLEAEMQLVLRCMETSKTIQPNSHGDAARMAPKICTIRVFGEDGTGRNPILSMINILD